jgi:hypothetical protein
MGVENANGRSINAATRVLLFSSIALGIVAHAITRESRFARYVTGTQRQTQICNDVVVNLYPRSTLSDVIALNVLVAMLPPDPAIVSLTTVASSHLSLPPALLFFFSSNFYPSSLSRHVFPNHPTTRERSTRARSRRGLKASTLAARSKLAQRRIGPSRRLVFPSRRSSLRGDSTSRGTLLKLEIP